MHDDSDNSDNINGNNRDDISFKKNSKYTSTLTFSLCFLGRLF